MTIPVNTIAVVAASIMLVGCFAHVTEKLQKDIDESNERVYQAIIKMTESTIKIANENCDAANQALREAGQEPLSQSACNAAFSDSPGYRMICATLVETRGKQRDAKSRYYINGAIDTANQMLMTEGIKPCV